MSGLIWWRPVAGRCPRCGSGDILPSRRRPAGPLLRLLRLRRYRCMSCLLSFVAPPSSKRPAPDPEPADRPPGHGP